MSNADLNKAGRDKKDRFYTQLVDIEKEMMHYKGYFRGKIVYCNCDDPYESNFFKYFALNFNHLGLKQLMTTCYATSPVAGKQLSLDDVFAGRKAKLPKSDNKKPYKIVINEVPDLDGNGAIDLTDVQLLLKSRENTLTLLKGDGDFRSDECIELLKKADVVVTNPPFSLFREYVAQLVEYQKDYIIIGNVNCVTYKEVFPLIKDNKMWMGVSIHSGDREFRVPDDYPLEASGWRIDDEGNKYIRVKGVRWFTNVDNKNRHEEIDLYKKYTPEEYPKYANYDAIHVKVTAEIPCDYYGEMGVPITFLDKYNPNQFIIIGNNFSLAKPMSKIANKGEYAQGGPAFYTPCIDPKYKYHREFPHIIIKRRIDHAD